MHVKCLLGTAWWTVGAQQVVGAIPFPTCPCGYCPHLFQAPSGSPCLDNPGTSQHGALPPLPTYPEGIAAYPPRSSAVSASLPLLVIPSSLECPHQNPTSSRKPSFLLLTSGILGSWSPPSPTWLSSYLPLSRATSEFPKNGPHPLLLCFPERRLSHPEHTRPLRAG